MFENIGFGELLIILLVILIFFGAKKIPEIAHGFGKGIREFKKGLKDIENDIKVSDDKVNNSGSKKV
jgi:sec-independent protein translocase protein TatA